MKMIRAIIRPEKEPEVTNALADAGFFSLTKMEVYGRGKQRGLDVGTIHYDELPKVQLMLVVEDQKSVDEVIEIVNKSAYTGNFGDGKIFVSPVEEVYTVRTAKKGI